MPVASVFTSAASFFYAVSSLLNGAQNNAAVQQSFVQNFASSPSHLIPIQRRDLLSNSTGLEVDPKVYFPVNGYPQVDTAFPVRSTSARSLFQQGPVQISYHDGETIATLETDGYGNVTRCELLEVNKPSEQQEALGRLAAEQKIIEKTNFHTMLNIIRACQALDPKEYREPPPPSSPIHAIVQRKANTVTIVSGILPGTKWCGLKDIANGWNDLGPERELDKCCRSHDLCPRKVLAFRAAYGLVNWSFYTKSHCECDAAFFDCLKRAAEINPTAHAMGNFYFNVLRVQCIDDEAPPKCIEPVGVSCSRWESDEATKPESRLVFRDTRQAF